MLQISTNLKSVPADARKFLVHAAFTKVKACICTYGKEPTLSFIVPDFTVALSVWWRFFCAMSRYKIGELEDAALSMRMQYHILVKSMETGKEQNIKVYLSADQDGINYGLED